MKAIPKRNPLGFRAMMSRYRIKRLMSYFERASVTNTVLVVICLYLILVFIVLTLPQAKRSISPIIENYESHKRNVTTKQRRLPQAIIIGARKCGTRALLKFLELNPQIRAAQEEIHFFDHSIHYNRGLEWYRSRMPPSDEGQITIEKSPSYFVTLSVPERIRAMNASIKLILIVRDPVTRLISDYSQSLVNRANRGRRKIVKFEKLVFDRNRRVDENYRAVKIGMFALYLERWRAYFDPSQIHVVDGERLISNPYDEMRQVEQFLQLKPHIRRDHFVYNSTKGFYCLRFNLTLDHEIMSNKQIRHAHQQYCLNDSKGRKHQLVAEDTKRELRQFYMPSNEYLFSLIGRKFNWSNDIEVKDLQTN